MKVILLETMSELGMVGDVVNVKPGFARNFLYPRKKAISADSRNLKHLGHQKMILEHKLKRAKKAAEDSRKALEKQKIVIKRKVGENEKLFGAVTTLDLEHAFRDLGVTVNRKAIHLEEPIRKLGKYHIPVKLDGGLEAKVVVEVLAENA
jgi:large subunit ribosomal protein L9